MKIDGQTYPLAVLNLALERVVRRRPSGVPAVCRGAAAKLIQTFLLNTMASSGKQADDAESEADKSADDTELHQLKLPSHRFHELLHSVKEENSFTEN